MQGEREMFFVAFGFTLMNLCLLGHFSYDCQCLMSFITGLGHICSGIQKITEETKRRQHAYLAIFCVDVLITPSLSFGRWTGSAWQPDHFQHLSQGHLAKHMGKPECSPVNMQTTQAGQHSEKKATPLSASERSTSGHVEEGRHGGHPCAASKAFKVVQVLAHLTTLNLLIIFWLINSQNKF